MSYQEEIAKNLPKTKAAKRFYAALAALVLVVLATFIFNATSNTPSNKSAAPVAVVRITKTGFTPATISVPKGTRVVWTNTDNKLHQIEANPYPKGTDLPSLKSQILNDNQSYTYTANTTGTYGYHDQLHPTINGAIVVQKQ